MQRNLLEALKKWQHSSSRKPLLLQGARQVGKTYLLRHFGDNFFSRYYYVNFETDLHLHRIFDQNLDPKRILIELSFEFNHDISFDTDLLIFDEIQACPNALTSLKYFQEMYPQLFIAAAGSLLGVHMNIGSFPVGKVDILTLHPLNFIEFINALDKKQLLKLLLTHDWQSPIPEIAHQQLWELWKLFTFVGGMPEIIECYSAAGNQSIKIFETVNVKQNELLKAYYSDIAKHAGKTNAMHITRVFSQAAAQLSSTHNQEAERFKFKDVIPGVDRYQRLASAIDWLMAAHLTNKISIVRHVEQPLKVHIKESLFKLFYMDVGLLSAHCHLSMKSILTENYASYKGFIAENCVAQELFSTDEHAMQQLFCWQDNKAEIEFLQETEKGIIPIEVKSGTRTKTRSLDKFCQKYSPALSVVLSANNIYFDKQNKRYFCPIYLAALQPWLHLS